MLQRVVLLGAVLVATTVRGDETREVSAQPIAAYQSKVTAEPNPEDEAGWAATSPMPPTDEGKSTVAPASAEVVMPVPEETASPEWRPIPEQTFEIPPDAVVAPTPEGEASGSMNTDIRTFPKQGNVLYEILGPSWSYGSGVTYLAGDDDSLELTTVDVGPGFAMDFFDRPRGTDVPWDLYRLGFPIAFNLSESESTIVSFAIMPSVQTDFEQTQDESFRLPTSIAARRKLTDEFYVTAGVHYYDREDIQVLPIAGLTYKTASVHHAIVFPHPKLSWRLPDFFGTENWLFVAGRLAGNSWAVERSSGVQDMFTYSDLRATAGIDFIDKCEEGGPSCTLEAGYVFDREVRYHSHVGEFDPPETWMARIAFGF